MHSRTSKASRKQALDHYKKGSKTYPTIEPSYSISQLMLNCFICHKEKLSDDEY